MRVGIFYLSRNPGRHRQPFALKDGQVIWIRLEEVRSRDEGDALELATPADDESLMNTHELPGSQS